MVILARFQIPDQDSGFVQVQDGYVIKRAQKGRCEEIEGGNFLDLLRRTNCNYVVVLVIAIDVMLLYCAHACTSRLNMCVIVVLTRVVHSVP